MKIKRKELVDMLAHIEESLQNLLHESDYDDGICYAIERLEDLSTNLKIHLDKK